MCVKFPKDFKICAVGPGPANSEVWATLDDENDSPDAGSKEIINRGPLQGTCQESKKETKKGTETGQAKKKSFR